MEKIWKDIKDFEGFYEVSNYGEVRNVKTKRVLKGYQNKRGYLQVSLSKNGKRETKTIHRLVMETFCPIKEMENLQVNHKSEIKTNNCLDNLEWTNPKENCNYGTRNKRISTALSKAVKCVETGVVYSSISEAAQQTGVNLGNISQCCRGKRKTAGGLAWLFVEVNELDT